MKKLLLAMAGLDGIRRSRSRIGCRYARQGSAAPACGPDLQLDRLLHRRPRRRRVVRHGLVLRMQREEPLIPPCGLAQGGHSASSWLAGGQVGFNYQVGRFVWGIEADFSATRIKGSNLDAAFPLQEFLHSRTDFIGTVAPRVGVAWDRVLLYAKGGVAWAHDDYWLTLTPNQLLAGQTFVTGTQRGWAGWSASGSSTHSRKIGPSRPSTTIWILEPSAFSSRAPAWNPHSLTFDEDIGRKIQVVKVGLNYKFDWAGPLVGRY